MAGKSTMRVRNCFRSAAYSRLSLIERFADYSFNRAHAACYAYVAYQTAWLKAHYPVEYMAALLTSVKEPSPSLRNTVFGSGSKASGSSRPGPVA